MIDKRDYWAKIRNHNDSPFHLVVEFWKDGVDEPVDDLVYWTKELGCISMLKAIHGWMEKGERPR